MPTEPKTVLEFDSGKTEVTTHPDGSHTIEHFDRIGNGFESIDSAHESAGENHDRIVRDYANNHGLLNVIRIRRADPDAGWEVRTFLGRLGEGDTVSHVLWALNEMGQAAPGAHITQIYGGHNRVVFFAPRPRGQAMDWKCERFEGRCLENAVAIAQLLSSGRPSKVIEVENLPQDFNATFVFHCS